VHPGQQSKTFVVPAGAGSYAPEIIYLRMTPTQMGSLFDPVSELTVIVESLPAAAQIEIDIIKPGTAQEGDAVAGNWLTNLQTHTSTGIKALLQLARIAGIRLRAKSGGTAGNSVVHAWWW